jgi:hypothetical protein
MRPPPFIAAGHGLWEADMDITYAVLHACFFEKLISHASPERPITLDILVTRRENDQSRLRFS